MRVRGVPDRRRTAPTGSERRQHQPSTARASFADLLHQAEVDEARANLQAGLEMIDRAAHALRDSPSLETLNQYKKAIRDVLAPLLAAYSVEELRGFNRYGKRTIHVLVRIVDEKLDELARLVLSNAQDALAIAARIDDIRGILLDWLR